MIIRVTYRHIRTQNFNVVGLRDWRKVRAGLGPGRVYCGEFFGYFGVYKIVLVDRPVLLLLIDSHLIPRPLLLLLAAPGVRSAVGEAKGKLHNLPAAPAESCDPIVGRVGWRNRRRWRRPDIRHDHRPDNDLHARHVTPPPGCSRLEFSNR